MIKSNVNIIAEIGTSHEGSLEKDSQKLLSIQTNYVLDKEKLENGYFVLHRKNNIIYSANLHSDVKIHNNDLKLTRKELNGMFFLI